MSDFEDIYDETEEEQEEQYLVFKAKGVDFAVAVSSVREMIPIPEIVPIPDSPPWMRGVVNLRNETFKLIDFRSRVGMKSLQQEQEQVIKELEAREQEHKQWVDDLEQAVREEQPFHGETDPHKCNFGRWYDNFTSNNGAIMLELRKFDEPHKMIHSTAKEALDLQQNGKHDDALELIEQRRSGELARLVTLFDNLKHHIREEQKEVIVLLNTADDRFALAVDQVEAVESVRSADEKTLANFQQKKNGFVRYSTVGLRAKSDDIVYIVQPEWIIGGGESDETPAESTEDTMDEIDGAQVNGFDDTAAAAEKAGEVSRGPS
jgi:purine-binding chemotaxis protein CheW